ncbi:transcriptional regulator, TetR family [Quadrisphaera granulorum]|uniref:TetR family transcriptional regulator n=1 Tax=Quadrisphaera granulorum TaxID=317664 RepID=A0A316A9M2_9ACTN|nr:TetR family transcriptional regulator [Quadrisphaera granulorum]PWJ46497.1 TetR family transcriptional regulator [Quadrisphaera granulorum]SZE99055.1 transcriptional regulator, TetR family [Quadrisphaera granulorum]
MSPRTYSSPVRDAAAAQTRERVLRAVAVLMSEHGYGRTTMRDIASTAGVSVQTVNLLGPKSRLIAEALALAFMGDADATDLGSAAAMREIMAIADTDAAISAYAQALAAALERSCRLARTMKAAADTDDTVRDLVLAGEEHRRRDMQLAARWMLDRGLITEDQLDEAADVHALVTSIETAHHFLVDREWSVDRFAAWLEQAIRRMVLDGGASQAGRPSRHPRG